MELDIVKYLGKNQKEKREYYTIKSYKAIHSNSSLLLVGEEVLQNEDETKSNFYEIYKVQFILSCKIELADNLLIAFYLGEGGELCPYILSGLPNDYFQDTFPFLLIDYKSYAEICELTGETKLSLADYIKEIKSGHLGTNAFLENENQLLNYDQQKELFKKASL